MFFSRCSWLFSSSCGTPGRIMRADEWVRLTGSESWKVIECLLFSIRSGGNWSRNFVSRFNAAPRTVKPWSLVDVLNAHSIMVTRSLGHSLFLHHHSNNNCCKHAVVRPAIVPSPRHPSILRRTSPHPDIGQRSIEPLIWTNSIPYWCWLLNEPIIWINDRNLSHATLLPHRNGKAFH